MKWNENKGQECRPFLLVLLVLVLPILCFIFIFDGWEERPGGQVFAKLFGRDPVSRSSITMGSNGVALSDPNSEEAIICRNIPSLSLSPSLWSLDGGRAEHEETAKTRFQLYLKKKIIIMIISISFTCWYYFPRNNREGGIGLGFSLIKLEIFYTLLVLS